MTKTVNCKADCTIKEVIATNPIPETQSLVKILKYLEKGIIVVTTETNHNKIDNNNSTCFWYYDYANVMWT